MNGVNSGLYKETREKPPVSKSASCETVVVRQPGNFTSAPVLKTFFVLEKESYNSTGVHDLFSARKLPSYPDSLRTVSACNLRGQRRLPSYIVIGSIMKLNRVRRCRRDVSFVIACDMLWLFFL
jgi:hypothetical protein